MQYLPFFNNFNKYHTESAPSTAIFSGPQLRSCALSVQRYTLVERAGWDILEAVYKTSPLGIIRTVSMGKKKQFSLNSANHNHNFLLFELELTKNVNLILNPTASQGDVNIVGSLLHHPERSLGSTPETVENNIRADENLVYEITVCILI